MSTQPQYASTVGNGFGTLATGDTSRTAPTTFVTAYTAGASGSRVDSLDFVAVGNTVASGVRVFIYDGATYRLLTERAVVVSTAAAGAVWELHLGTAFNPDIFPIELKPGQSLRCTVNDTQTGISVIGRGADF